jgi:hypothetical protein
MSADGVIEPIGLRRKLKPVAGRIDTEALDGRPGEVPVDGRPSRRLKPEPVAVAAE